MVYESLKDKTALVTGGTSGIGKAIAKHLLMNGVNVIINYSNDDVRANEAYEELMQYGNVVCFKADITNEEQIVSMYKQIDEQYGKLDYLINNAGINVDGWIESFNIDDWKNVINVNLVGKIICTKNAIPLLKKSSTPRVVNISSKLGTKPCSESSAYCAAAASIINFTKASALELSKYKIRVNTVSPGFTPTPLSLAGWTKEEIEEKKAKSLLGRLGELSDTTNAVLFLLSDEADYINGENINVNGGSLLV